ncbi:helix-turn-helix domain-containing protein [Streptomyces sp. 8N616]|uniref:helix-turn-helix domain-containing protein n=1 Tax=Streptomyces sp. 8N616 TaxID=3457414 RepID=UPI003FD0A8CA
MHPYRATDPARPSFNPDAARRARQAIGLGPEEVSRAMRAAYGAAVAPITVLSWESGDETPTEAELRALAGALWCSIGDLMGTPTTVHQHRLARRVSAWDVAVRLGVAPETYETMERTGRWMLTERQTGLLAEMLELPMSAYLEVCGQTAALDDLLRKAVTTRWQAYIQPVCRLLPLPRARVEGVLHYLHAEYQSVVGTLDWGGGTISREPNGEGRAFLGRIVELFCERLDL